MLNHIFSTGSTGKYTAIRALNNSDSLPDSTLTWESAGLALYYHRSDAVSPVLITLSALSFIPSGNGIYFVLIPDAALIAGVDFVIIHGSSTDHTFSSSSVQLDVISSMIISLSSRVIENDGTNDITEIKVLRAMLRYVLANKTVLNGVHAYKKMNGSDDSFDATIDSSGGRTMGTIDLT